MIYDPSSRQWLLFVIRGAGSSVSKPSSQAPLATSSQLYTAATLAGPWHAAPSGGFGHCNNPAPAVYPNGTLYVVCHNDQTLILWRAAAWNATWEVLWDVSDYRPAVPGNCEDPFLFFDASGNFHIVAHCYTCYWYPSPDGAPGKGAIPCDGNARPSAHGFSRDGRNFTWAGAMDAPYTFSGEVEQQASATQGKPATKTDTTATERIFSTRERPVLALDDKGQPWALINGVSPAFPQLKFVEGRDWTYTFMQPVTN